MLDPNGDFNSPCYDDTFRRSYFFVEEFNDSEHYFIELDYYIMREAFVSRKHLPLDLNIQHYDDAGGGEQIFRDVSDAEKQLLAARGYIVLEEHIDTSTSDYGDIYKVTEIYGYVPNKTFVTYESVVRNTFGYVQKSGAVVGGVSYDLNWDCFKIADSGTLAVGDEVGFLIVWELAVGYLPPTTIFAVDGSYAYANPVSCNFYHTNGAYGSFGTELFAWWARYPSGYMTINNVRMTKPSSFRAFLRRKQKSAAQEVSLARKEIQFSLTPPTGLRSAYRPVENNGAITDVFSERTTPTVYTHLQNVKNNKQVLMEDEGIDPTLWHGLYRKTAIFVPAR